MTRTQSKRPIYHLLFTFLQVSTQPNKKEKKQLNNLDHRPEWHSRMNRPPSLAVPNANHRSNPTPFQ